MTGFKEDFSELMNKNGFCGYEGSEEKFELLSDALAEFNAHTNVTAIKGVRDIIVKHIADSLSAEKLIPQGASLIDIGCGGGFPSLPLATARPDISVLSVDSVAKKLKFIDEMKEKLGLANIRALPCRAEELAKDALYREKFDVATARAVAPLNVLSELCLPFVKVGGVFLALKGKNADAELCDAKNAMEKLGGRLADVIDVPLELDGEIFEHKIIVIEKSKKTDIIYPRAYAKISAKPL